MLAPIEGSSLVTSGLITDIERTTLIEVRDRLRRGEITTEQCYNDPYSHFNMASWLHCVWGLCYTISNGEAFTHLRIQPFSETDDRLIRLFLPENLCHRTAAEGEHAITTFLATGNAEWSHAHETSPILPC